MVLKRHRKQQKPTAKVYLDRAEVRSFVMDPTREPPLDPALPVFELPGTAAGRPHALPPNTFVLCFIACCDDLCIVNNRDQANHSNRVLPILYWIRLISRIKLEPVKHDLKLVKVFLCLPLPVGLPS